ncbi:MAG TPA: PAS domain S-box protein [Terriglobia bacterium]|nr:PAS domain S-box protein [Terriglobia bacterium]
METNVLLIEDNPGDARLILEMLKEAGGDGFVVHRVDRLSTAVENLSAQAADAVLLDLGLPDSQGLGTFSRIHSQFSEIPIVVLTVLNNEAAGMQAVRAGAQDYLVKGVISGTALTRVLRYGIERKRAEEALRVSERRYRLLFEHNMAAVLRTVGDGHIVDANEACARMLGYDSRDELLKKQMWELWYQPEDRPAFIARLQKERALTTLELCFRRKDGTPVVALANMTFNGGKTTEAPVIEATLIDITDRKRAEDALYRNQRVLAQAERIAHLGAWEMEISNREDLNQNRLHWSDETYRIFGYEPGAVEATNQLFFHHVHPDDRLRVIDGFSEAIAQQKPYVIEHRIQRCDGAERAVIEHAEILKDSQGRPERVIGTVQDITDRKRAEEERKRLVTAIEQCAETIVITDPKGTIQYVNPTFTKVSGYSREEAVGSNPRLLKSGKHDASFFQSFWNTLLAGNPWHGEMVNRRKDGSLYTDELHVAPVRDARGEIVHFISNQLDVTERKRAEEAEAEAELKYRGLFEHMSEGLAYCRMLFENGEGQDFIYLTVNKAFETLTGLKDVVGKRVTAVIPGIRESNPGLLEIYARVALTGIPERFETFVDALGMWFSISAYSPEKEFFVAIFDVITERKRAEEERKRLVTAIEQCAETIIITDLKGTIQWVNPTFTKVTGYSREEAVGANPRLLKSGKHDASFFQSFWNALLTGKPWHGEMINRRKDGSLYTDELRVSPVRDSRGEIIHFISNQLDVTEHKRAEAENLRLVTAMEQAAEGIVITDLEPRIQYVNPAFTKITGYSRAEALGQNPRLLKSGKHGLRFYKEMWGTILSGETWHGEIFNRRKDGTLYTEEMTITPVRDSRGVTTNFIAIKEDVTERKRAEQALNASETRYRRLFEAAQDGVLLLDSETGTITDANPFVLKLLGYSREELLGKRLWDVGPFRDVAASQDAFRNLQKAGYVRYEDLPLETKGGDRIDVEFVSSSYSEGDKKVIQCSIRDITERKWQEELILASLREKEMLLKEIHHRVKNNLQVISSLLQLRAGAIKDDALREMFRESQNRVRTMALIHEKLYHSGDLAHIDFREYVLSLVTDLFQSYRTDPDAVSFAVSGDKVSLAVDTAIPCGLIVNELVSNCLKHAFPARNQPGLGTRDSGLGARDSGKAAPGSTRSSANPEPRTPNPDPVRQDEEEAPGGVFSASPESRGLITIALTEGEGGKVRLVVRDNGVGFPRSMDFRNTQSLGLQLVNALTDQLGGTIQMHANGGTEFQIEFGSQ